MKTLLAELQALQASLVKAAASVPAGQLDPTGVDAFVRAMARKCSFTSIHLRLLEAVTWDRVNGLGREPLDGGGPEYLTVSMRDARLEIRHPDAVIDHVYLALDGLVAATANLTDTFGRLVNQFYMLQIPSKQASLLAIRDRCATTSPLGRVLHDSQNTDWLLRIRDLRGRCQHADIEEVLETPAAKLGSRSEPTVPAQYCWPIPPTDTRVAEYASAAAKSVIATLAAASAAIRAQPLNPHQ